MKLSTTVRTPSLKTKEALALHHGVTTMQRFYEFTPQP
jgi:hypothetical protein